jgi:hypothetical protein
VWTGGGEYGCCGPARRIDEDVELSLILGLGGSVRESHGPDRCEGFDAGTTHFVGRATGATVGDKAWNRRTIVDCGPLQVAVNGEYPPGVLECRGQLCEAQHSPGAPSVTGRLVRIRWHENITEATAFPGSLRIVGSEPVVELTSVEERFDGGGDLEFVVDFTNLADGVR